MAEELVGIDGGALWARLDLGVVMVVDPVAFQETLAGLPDGMLDPLEPDAVRDGDAPRGAIAWEADVGLLGETIRMCCRVASITEGLELRVGHLAGEAKGVPARRLDLCEGAGGFELWRDGVYEQTVETRQELVGTAYVSLLDAAVSPRRMVLYVHAAAVVWKGMPMLLSAPSGGGKTTLTLGLVAAGAELMTDDTVGILGDDLSLLGLPVALRVRATGWAVVENLMAGAARVMEPDRHGVRHVVPHRTRGLAGPAPAVVVLRFVAGAETAWHALSAAEGFAAVIEGGAALPARPDSETAAVLARWCDQTRFYALTYGSLEGGVAGVDGIRSSLV